LEKVERFKRDLAGVCKRLTNFTPCGIADGKTARQGWQLTRKSAVVNIQRMVARRLLPSAADGDLR
jgi:hypothetical protein